MIGIKSISRQAYCHSRLLSPQYCGCECRALEFTIMRVSGGIVIVRPSTVSGCGNAKVDLQMPMSGL